MRKILPFILVGGGAIVLLMLSRGMATKNLKVYFKDLLLKPKPGFNIPGLILRFNLVNGSNTAIKVRSIVGDLLVNGNVLSSVQQLSEIIVPANSTTIATVTIETPTLNTALTIIDIIRNRRGFKIGFDGQVNAQGVLIPVKQEITLF